MLICFCKTALSIHGGAIVFPVYFIGPYAKRTSNNASILVLH
jgi:hypothetical protein